MGKFEVLILGNASASPTMSRSHTAQIINMDEEYFLMDCGEGTQLKLREYKIKIQRINHIFISHLHGDHFLGLMGLLQTMHLLGRQSELNIYCCGDVEEIVNVHLKHAKGRLGYQVVYNKVSATTPQVVFQNQRVRIKSFPLKHKIDCTGFIFEECPTLKNINPAAIQKYQLPKYSMKSIKEGQDYTTPEGKIIKNELLTLPNSSLLSYAFCSDTAFLESIVDEISGVDLLYHEATFMEEHADRAKKTLHSTAKQAALIAKMTKANRLIIGHFSNRYTDLGPILEEAKSVFKNTEIAAEGKCFDVSETQ